MPDVMLKDEFGISQPYEDINAVLLDTEGGGTATFISPDIIPVQVQADWEQTDETAVDFIKNKPTSFGGDYTHPNTHPASMITGLVVKDLPSLEIASYEFIYSDTFGCYMYTLPKAWDDLLGTTYKITWDGEEYTRVCRDINEINETMSGSYYIGNPAKITNMNIGEDTGEPFFILFSYGEGRIFTDDSSNSHRFGITPIDEVKKLDSKYLPDGLATQEWVNNEISKIDVNDGGSSGAIETEIFPETKLEGFQLSGNSYSIGFPATFELIVGEEYKVYWDGEYYTCTAFEDVQGSYNLIMLGNCEAVTQGSTVITEPFVITYVPDNNYINVASADGSTATSHTVCIYRKIDAPTIPEFTTEDEGKVLGIKDGAVNWVNVESSVTVKEEDILPEQEFTFTPVDGDEGLFQFMTDTKESELLQILSVLKPGETYYVAIDGVEYECDAQSCFEVGVPRPANSEIYADAALGNIGIANPESTDTGEPFVVMVLSYAQFSDDGSISNENHNAGIVVRDDASAESVTKSIRIYKKIEESNNYIKWDELCREDNVTTETDLFKKQTVERFSRNSLYQGLYSTGRNFPESGYTDGLVDSFNIIIGESYVVEWDGTVYHVVGQDGSAVMPNTTFLGDASAFGIGENTGEPFIIGVQKGAGVSFMSPDETIDSHTIRIYTSASSIETNIKSEFLPKHLQFGEKNITISFIDTDVKFTYVESNGWSHNPIPITSDIHLEAGKTYTVEWNGNVYVCDSIEVMGFAAIGNPALADAGDDNGLPFAIAEDINGLVYGAPSFVMMTNEVDNIDTSITTELLYSVKITYTGLITEKINTKYLYQPDWNEVDSSKGGYILNKPFGDMKAGTIIFNDTVTATVDFSSDEFIAVLSEPIPLIDGASYTIKIDGVHANDNNAFEVPYDDGNVSIMLDSIDVYRFIMNFENSGLNIIVAPDMNPHVYQIILTTDAVQKIDKKYLPDDIGGSSLPEVTSSDAGKFLRVDSTGVWVAETIPNAEGVSF